MEIYFRYEKGNSGSYEEACRVNGIPCELFSYLEGVLEVIFPGQSILVIHGISWNDQADLIL